MPEAPTTSPRVLDGVGLADLKAEHAMQYTLLAEAERLLAKGETAGAHQVLQQLLQYSEAHFGSEEIVMRLHSYPGYHQHLREQTDGGDERRVPEDQLQELDRHEEEAEHRQPPNLIPRQKMQARKLTVVMLRASMWTSSCSDTIASAAGDKPMFSIITNYGTVFHLL